MGAALRAVHAGMIGQRAVAHGGEIGGELFGVPARGTIDDAAVAAMSRDHPGDLGRGIGFRPHRQTQIGPVEGAQEKVRRRGEELFGDFGARRPVRRRRHGDGLDAAERLGDGAQAEIFLAEVMAPLRDAMGFVDRQEIDAGLAQQRRHVRPRQPFRRDIDEPQVFFAQRPFDARRLGRRCWRNSALRRRAHRRATARPGRASARSAARPPPSVRAARSPAIDRAAICRCRSASRRARSRRRKPRRGPPPGPAGTRSKPKTRASAARALVEIGGHCGWAGQRRQRHDSSSVDLRATVWTGERACLRGAVQNDRPDELHHLSFHILSGGTIDNTENSSSYSR